MIGPMDEDPTVHIRLDIRDHIATITLNRPEVRNALTVAIVEDIARVVTQREARDDTARSAR